MRVRNNSKMVLCYVKIHRKCIGKTIVVHNLNVKHLSPEGSVHTAYAAACHTNTSYFR